jgi:hypothetical protein
MPTQKDVETKSIELEKFYREKYNISGQQNMSNFLYENYEVMLEKKRPRRLDSILIDDCQKKTLGYKSPEQIDLNFQTVCFYLALQNLGVHSSKW